MSHWVKCTDSKSDETVYVNIDNAMSVTRGKKGDTIIAFPGGRLCRRKRVTRGAV